MLTIWGRKTSSNVQALMWCVAELGLPFARQDIGHEHGGLGTPEFGALNPNRTVPVLRDEGAEFTLADIQLGHILFRYYDIAIERANLNHLRRYYHDLCQRPAYREHVMVSYDVLRVSYSTIRNT